MSPYCLLPPEDVPALSDPSEREGSATDARRNKGNKVTSSKAAGNRECGWLTLFDLDRTCSQLGVIGSLAPQDTLLPICAHLFSPAKPGFESPTL